MMNLKKTDIDCIFTVKVKDLYENAITPVIQRDHVQRVNAGDVDYFETRLPSHMIYGIAIFDGDDNTEFEYGEMSITVNKGDVFLVDGNTRREFNTQRRLVNTEIADYIDNGYAMVTVRKFTEQDELDKYYTTFDSKQQLKTNKHIKQSALSLCGLDSIDYDITTMMNKVCKSVKRGDMADEIYRKEQIDAFGVEIITSFDSITKEYESKIGKSLPKKYGICSWLAAYRKLCKDNPTRVDAIKKAFMKVWTYDVTDEIKAAELDQKPGGSQKRSGVALLAALYCGHSNHVYLTDSTVELRATNNGDKVEIQSYVIYALIDNFVKGKDIFSRMSFSAKNAKEKFATTITL